MAAPGLLNPAMPRISRGTRGTRGHSIIEVLTAISISAILLAMAVPNFKGLRGPWVLSQTAQQVAAEFQMARMRAITRNARYRFSYDATAKMYSMQREVSPGAWVAERTNTLPSGTSITPPGTMPIFDTRGMLNGTTTIPVNVQGYSKTRTVTINVLGNVTIS